MNPEVRRTMLRLGLDPDHEAKPEWASPERVWKREVKRAALQLASDAWLRRDIPGVLEAAAEVRELALLQIADDRPEVVQRDRVGAVRTGWVVHSQTQEWSDSYQRNSSELWRAYSDDQLALQVALTAILDITLSPEERVLIRLTYDAGMSLREVAYQLNQSHMTVKRRLQAIYEKMRHALVIAYGPVPEVIEVTP